MNDSHTAGSSFSSRFCLLVSAIFASCALRESCGYFGVMVPKNGNPPVSGRSGTDRETEENYTYITVLN